MILPLATAPAQTSGDSTAPSDAEIRQLLVDRIDSGRQGVGMVVGVIEPKGRRIVTHGSLDKGDRRPLNGDTVFEIGSMTKVFTSLALMDMAQRGEVAVTDLIQAFVSGEAEFAGLSFGPFRDFLTRLSGPPKVTHCLQLQKHDVHAASGKWNCRTCETETATFFRI